MNNRYNNVELLKDNLLRIQMCKNIIEYIHSHHIESDNLVIDQTSDLWHMPRPMNPVRTH